MSHKRKFFRAIAFYNFAIWFGWRCLRFLKSFTAKGELRTVRNESLKTVRADYPGNVLRDGCFLNEDGSSWEKPFPILWRWFLSPNPQKEEKKKDLFSLSVRPVKTLQNVPSPSLIWLGHSSFLIRLDDQWILTDPCLINPPYHDRRSDLPLALSSIPADYLLVSHGHYDHLDRESVRSLTAARIRALVPLGMKPLIESMHTVVIAEEAGWYQSYTLAQNFTVTLVPAHHWYLRNSVDYNRVLWGGYVLSWKNKKLFFAGDTAYAGHFKAIRETFGPIDYALLPIGAYRPDLIMSDAHMTPEECVRAFHDLDAKTFVPMHFGTFDLADEPLGEPLRWLRKLESSGAIRGKVIVPEVGEIVPLEA